jgi:molybdopterin-guanine dinucleotide biosynthesis protein B
MVKPERTIPVIAVVGRSGSGKTTLLEQVVPLLIKRGLRMCVVKHTWHKGIKSDIEGADTRRMWDAGVPHVVLVTPDRLVNWQRYEREPLLEDVLENISDVDLIILEGFKGSAVPKIEVLRQEHNPVPLPDLQDRIAFVADIDNLDSTCPCFNLEDYAGIANFLYRFSTRHQK